MANPRTPDGRHRFDPRVFREIPPGQWWLRVACMLAGVVLAGVGIGYFHAHRVLGDQVALGEQTRRTDSVVNGVPMNSYTSPDAVARYRGDAWPKGEHEAIWLGNSQIFAINQPTPDAQVAPWHLSKLLGWNVYGLNLPNANFQEFLVLQEFAFLRRSPDWVIMVLVFDDLREDNVRAEANVLYDDRLDAVLRTSPVGSVLATAMSKNAKAPTGDLQGTTRSKNTWILGISLQDICERNLQEGLGHLWHVWRERGETRAGIQVRLHALRNWVFGITNATVRRMMKAQYDKNMAALEDAVRRNAERGVHTLLYVAPLRRDVPPPYQMDLYEHWKGEVRSLAERHGAIFADLDTAVPDNLWGTVNGQDIDFMHYRGPGHEIVAQRLAEIIRAHPDRPDPRPSTSAPAGTEGTR